MLRYDSLKNVKIILYKGYDLADEMALAYWLAISKDNGLTWKKYYAGLVENYFYFIKPNPNIQLIKNDSVIQVEAAIVRRIAPLSHPIAIDELKSFELVQDNVVMELNLNEIVSDKDQDGLPDILEEKLGTNPLLKDTDGDGIDDAADPNPLYKNTGNKYAELINYLRDRRKEGFISFDSVKAAAITTNDTIKQTAMIITDNLDILGIITPSIRNIVLTNAGFKNYIDKNYVLFNRIWVSPFFQIDDKPGTIKFWIYGTFWSYEYLVTEKENGWIVKVIGGYIS